MTDERADEPSEESKAETDRVRKRSVVLRAMVQQAARRAKGK